MRIRVAGAQIPVTNKIEDNTDRICQAIDHAASMNAEILLTPEGSLSGYTHDFDDSAVHLALKKVVSFAQGKKLGLALATCFVEDDNKCFNQIRFYQPDGEYLGFHSKTLTCGSLEAQPKGEIEHYTISPLRVFNWNKKCIIGGLICNDMWANPECTPLPDPHLSQQLAFMGARIVFHAVNGGRNGSEKSQLAWQYHESNLRMRARAGGLWIVTVDNCYPTDIPCSAPSGVINPQGDWVKKTGSKGEHIFVHSIDLPNII